MPEIDFQYVSQRSQGCGGWNVQGSCLLNKVVFLATMGFFCGSAGYLPTSGSTDIHFHISELLFYVGIVPESVRPDIAGRELGEKKLSNPIGEPPDFGRH